MSAHCSSVAAVNRRPRGYPRSGRRAPGAPVEASLTLVRSSTFLVLCTRAHVRLPHPQSDVPWSRRQGDRAAAHQAAAEGETDQAPLKRRNVAPW
jgi:hypothetical protein